MLIKSIYDDVDIYDPEDLMKEIDEGHLVFLMNDSDISMVNGGNTEYGKDEDGYYQFSSGQNWRDQEKTYHSKEKIIESLKEAIENVLKDFEKYEYDTEDINVCYITIEQKDETPY